MSSILDALKRLEKEAPDPSVQYLETSWHDAPSANASLLKRFSGFLLRHGRSVCFAAATGLLIAVAAIVVSSGVIPFSLSKPTVDSPKTAAFPDLPEKKSAVGHRGLSEEKPTAAAAATKPDAVKTKNAANAADRTKREEFRASPAKRRFSEDAAGSRADKQNRQAGTKIGKAGSAGSARPDRSAAPQRAPAVSEKAASTAASVRSEGDPQQETVPADSNRPDDAPRGIEAADSPPEPAPPEEFVQALPAQTGLDLQAISWDEDRKGRIAVINGRILREGERIEGYLLSEINPDDVLFENNGQVWKLEFRRQ